MDELTIDRIRASRLLNDLQARIAARAEFKCEYCGLCFLDSADNYCQWEWDHIVPRYHGGTDDESNIAAACRTCNVRYKSTWAPANHQAMTRVELIAAVTEHINSRRHELESRVNLYRDAVGMPRLS